MSLNSQLLGSFERTGNYPLEANYYFDTEQELKDFYSDSINKTTLHKGLLKVVGNLDLYWVTEDLTFKKLLSINSLDSLNDLKERLEILEVDKEEIDKLLDLLQDNVSNIIVYIKNIVGTNSENILEYLKTIPYNSITNLSNALSNLELKESNDISELVSLINEKIRELKVDHIHDLGNLQKELDATQTGIGLNGNGSYTPDFETNYLSSAKSIMHAFRILDGIVKNLNTRVDNITSITKVSDLVNDLKFLTEDEVNKIILKIIGTAPESLDTLGEIAEILSKDSDAISAINEVLAGKSDKADTYTKAEVDGKVSTLNSAISAESSRAITAEDGIKTNISNEIDRAKRAELALNDKIERETIRASGEEKRINDELHHWIDTITDKIDNIPSKNENDETYLPKGKYVEDVILYKNLETGLNVKYSDGVIKPIDLPIASIELNGLLSKEDKLKLNLININNLVTQTELIELLSDLNNVKEEIKELKIKIQLMMYMYATKDNWNNV